MESPWPYLSPQLEGSPAPGEVPASTVRFMMRVGAVIFFGMSLMLVAFIADSLTKWGRGIPQGVDLLYAARESIQYRSLQALIFAALAISYLVCGRGMFRYRRQSVIGSRWLSAITALLNLALFGSSVVIASSLRGYEEMRLMTQVKWEMRFL